MTIEIAVDQPTLRPSERQLRAELEGLILDELRGPAGGPDEEVAEDRVTERYLVGMVAPQRVAIRPEEHDAIAVTTVGEAGEEADEPVAPPVRSLVPSSLGMTFNVDGDTSEIVITAGWGRYQRLPSEVVPDGGAQELVWKREPCGGMFTMKLHEGKLGPTAPDSEQREVMVRGRAHRLSGDWLVSLFLVNGQPEPQQRRDEAWLFQVELSVEGVEGSSPFVRRPMPFRDSDPGGEAARLAMAYRDRVEFATGHGIATEAQVDPTDPRRATRIRTVAAPIYEVARTDPPDISDEPALAGVVLDMKTLAETSGAALEGLLQPLVEAYRGWTQRQERMLDEPKARLDLHGVAAVASLNACRRAADRIEAGVRLITSDPDAAESFRFANRAMWMQRVRSRVAERRRKSPDLDADAVFAEEDVPLNRSWRPFQLAFVLLCIPGVSSITHSERSAAAGLADLLWFPTGGGKTEAYLGLTAYILALRRLQGTVHGLDGASGVAVIMRYTLRLLTVQQFQRATALICACEAIREEELAAGEMRLGVEPFRIGLWVGRNTTPNTTEEAKRWIEQRRGAAKWHPGGSGSPAQLTTCPWCGSRIEPGRDLDVEDSDHTLTYCGDMLGRCRFTARRRPKEGLPVVVVDEEVYRLLPGLLIGTVDKFAQLPWVGATGQLFGIVSNHCSRHGFVWADLEHPGSHPRRADLPAATTSPANRLRPPDLILQDELHLITGPLGSLVGLYETAIGHLCEVEVAGKRFRPKVVASTATIRRSADQTHALFLRAVDAFPPSGIDAGDSFFARWREISDEAPGRRYLGVLAHGRRFKEVLIRVYVAALGAAQALYERHGAAADPWMTLVGYFGSIRELAGMRRLIDDDIATRLARMDRRGLARRGRPTMQELTSRRSSEDIPDLLERIGMPFTGDADAQPRPLDVVVATNMISVGVDVPRLGLMVVAGQPKSTSEYIQATSRVGRSHPGLVITVYNWARARDLSHFETFDHYHGTFYREVESATVTPFAPRALDRGLTAVLATLIRHGRPDWNPNRGAHQVDTHAAEALAAVDEVARHAELGAADAATGRRVREMLQARLDQWAAEIAAKPQLAYRRRGGDTVELLLPPDLAGWTVWTCPTSLRTVEPEINLQLVRDADLGDRDAPPFEPPSTSDAKPDAGV
jgi:Helicase conserved C-terminal domain